MEHWTGQHPVRTILGIALVLAALSTVALSDVLFENGAAEGGMVINAGGERLVGDSPELGEPIVSVTSLGEGLVNPKSLYGNRLRMRPGFIAQKRRIAVGVQDAGAAPVTYANRLEGNYPNPFNPATTIRFTLAAPGRATLKIYDVGGRLVRTLLDGPVAAAGVHELRWDGRSDGGSRVASGIYFARLVAGDFAEQHKLVMTR